MRRKKRPKDEPDRFREAVLEIRRLYAEAPNEAAAAAAMDRAAEAALGGPPLWKTYRERVLDDARRMLRELEERFGAAPDGKKSGKTVYRT